MSLTRRQTLLTGCLVACVVLISLHAHRVAGGWFPLPWPDESSFAWPSIALAERGSLVAPQANPDRPVFWMPPGYAFICAGVYRALGFSFGLMRGVSWVAVTGYFLLLAWWLVRDRWPVEAVVLAAGFMLGPFFVVMGNVGRMDGMALLTCLAGFFLIHRRRPWQGLSLLALACLVHPYAAVFGASGLAAALLVSPREFRRCSAHDVLALAAAGLPLAGYAAYVFANWSDFAGDMADQSAGHHLMLLRDLGISGPSPSMPALCLRALLTTKYTWVLGAYAALGLAVFLFDRPRLVLLAFGLPGLIVRVIGAEMWYVALAVNAILIWCVVALGFAAAALARRLGPRTAGMCRVALFVLVAGACAVAGLLPMTPRYPEGLKWWALRLERREPYMTAADVAAVVDAVSSRHSAGPRARIEVVPTGDGLWLYPASKDRFTTHAPLFCDVPAHGLLVHVAPGLDTAFPKLASRTRGATLIHRRGEHRWYLKPLETVPRAADNAARSGD